MVKVVKRWRNRSRTITRTFRIQQKWDEVLVEEAERQGISVNVLVNKILRGYSLFTRWAEKCGVMSFTQTMFQEILKEVSEDGLVRAGAVTGRSDIVDILNMIGLPLDYDSFVYLFLEHFGGSDYCRWFNCFHHAHGNQQVFHLQHNLGRKWSVYLERYLFSALSLYPKIKAEAKIYDYALNLKISSSKP